MTVVVLSLLQASNGAITEAVSLHDVHARRVGTRVTLSVCLPACLPACLSVCLFVSACLSVCLPVCLSVCLPVCRSALPACLPACLSVCLPACLPVCLPVCLSACRSVCLPACLSVGLPACLPVCRSAYLPACLTVCLCLTPGMINNSELYSFFTVAWSSVDGWLLTVTGLTGPDEQPVDLMTLSLCCKSGHDFTTAQPGTGRVTWSSGPRQKMPLHPRDTTNTRISLCC